MGFAGQTLVSINNTDIQAKADKLLPTLHKHRKPTSISPKDYERFQNLYKKSKCFTKELDDMQARYEMAKTVLQTSQMMKTK